MYQSPIDPTALRKAIYSLREEGQTPAELSQSLQKILRSIRNKEPESPKVERIRELLDEVARW